MGEDMTTVKLVSALRNPLQHMRGWSEINPIAAAAADLIERQAAMEEEIATLRTRNATLAAWINRGERQVAEQAAEIERLRAALGAIS